MPDPNTIGQDKTYKDAVDAYDAEHGTYADKVDDTNTASRLPTVNMPLAPNPNPFVLGGRAPGEREG